MGKKKNKNNSNSNNNNNNNNNEVTAEKKEQQVTQKQEQESSGDNQKGNNKKKSEENAASVFKIEIHCDGCASKIIKLARSFDGVETVKAEAESNKLIVTGKVDPVQIRDTLHLKTKKKVELISPVPRKDDSNNSKNDNTNKSNDTNKKPDNNNDNKKPKDKEAPVVTAVIKVAFHCMGCIEKIHKIVSKTKGVQDMKLDKQKETVTVIGTMDVKALTEVLKERLKRPAEIVPPKKDKDGDKDGENGGGDGKKKKGGGGAGQDNGGAGDMGPKMEGSKMEYLMQPGYGFGPSPGYGYVGQPAYGNGYMGQPVSVPVYGNGYMGMAPPVPVYDYGYGYGPVQVPGYPVHMKFNDENPNACSVM